MNEQDRKVVLYGGGGLSEAAASRPLRAEEKHHRHRAIADAICHDCGQIIETGADFISSTVTITEGLKAQSFTYPVHDACYNVLATCIQILPVPVAHMWGVGRKPLREMWWENMAAIDAADPTLAEVLRQAFGVAQ